MGALFSSASVVFIIPADSAMATRLTEKELSRKCLSSYLCLAIVWTKEGALSELRALALDLESSVYAISELVFVPCSETLSPATFSPLYSLWIWFP